MVKKKTIGIVLEKVEGEILTGSFTTSEVLIQLDELSRLEITNPIIRRPFKLNTKEKVLKLYVGTLEDSRKIAAELIKVGYKDLKILFNDKLYDVESDD